MFRSYTETIRTKKETNPSSTKAVLQAYACDLCDDNYWHSETDVELHRKETHLPIIREQLTRHPERFCTICMTLHENSDDLLTHIKTSHLLSSPTARRVEREIFICDHCNCILFNKAMLEAHIMYLHLWKSSERVKKSFTCPKCQKTIKLKSIWFHLQVHEIPSLSVCEICLTHCGNIRELYCHLKTHNMYYKCDICDYHTTKEHHFESHLDNHQNSQVQTSSLFKMGKMAKVAFTRQNIPYPVVKYNIHHTLKGLELPRFIRICTLCREICTNKAEMKIHMLRDHARPSPPRRASLCRCGEEFFNRVLLKHHLFKVGSQGGLHRELTEGEKPVETMIEIEISNIGATLQSNQNTNRKNIPNASTTAEIKKETLTKQRVLTKIKMVDHSEETLDTRNEGTFELGTEGTLDTETDEASDMENQEMLGLKTEETPDTRNQETCDMENEETIDTEIHVTLDTETGELIDMESEVTDDKDNEGTLVAVSEETTMKEKMVEKRPKVEEKEFDNGVVVDSEMQNATDDEITYIYAEIDDDELVTVESQPNERVLGF